MTSVTISTIRNSCIVNNANIAVQNLNITPLDAINNWWGMPTGATHDNVPSGDAVGQNIFHAPHLPTMPFLCDLTNADWIPFSEQDLQHAINSHIPHLGGIAFALIDLEWGRGAKFDIVTHPNYGNLHGVAYISIKPNPTGDLITLQLDITRLPTDETIQKIVTCELVPLFVNSLQQVQNRYVSPSQNITSMVVMERDLMMRFTPPTEITPDPAPEIIMNYDASCLPEPIILPMPTPSPTPPQNEDESGWLVGIPPLEGEFSLLETGTMQESQSNIIFLDVDTTLDDANLDDCTDALEDCSLRGAVGIARDVNNRNNPYVIRIPNDSYVLASELIIEGNVTLVGQDGYGTDTEIAGVFITNTVALPIFYIRHFNETGISTPSNVTIYNITFQNSNAFTAGAIDIQSSNVNIYNSQFINNTAQWGGAISVDTQASPSSVRSVVEIKNGLFLDNTAVYIGGAMIGHTGGSITKVYCSIFEDNHANYGGGAIGASSYTSFSGQITVSESNFINNTVSPSHPVQGNGGGAIHRTSGTVALSGNYWSPNNPPSTSATAINSIMGVSAGTVNNQPFARNCEVPPPPTNQQTQCSDPNDFRKLTEENTDLADREACWLRYKEIIYLTIYHEFSMDNQLVFDPKQISQPLYNVDNPNELLFSIEDYIYCGVVDKVGFPGAVQLYNTAPDDCRQIIYDELTPLSEYTSPYNPYYTFARAIINGMRNTVQRGLLDNPSTPSDQYIDPMRYFPTNYFKTVEAEDNWLLGGVCNEYINYDIIRDGITIQTVSLCKDICDGNFSDIDFRRGNEANRILITCNNEEWFTEKANQWLLDTTNIRRFNAYKIVMPEIERAIHDMVYGNEGEPLWLSVIYGVVPANKSLPQGSGTYRDGNGVSCFTPPLGTTGEPYVFDTYLGYLWKLSWSTYTSNCADYPNIFYSASLWDDQSQTHTSLNDMEESCQYPDETIPQSYMRHLRETYGSLINDLALGSEVTEIPQNRVRFGMANRSVHIPVMGIKFHPLRPNEIRQIVWYTFRFNIGSNNPIPIPPSTTIPANGIEFVVYEGTSVIMPLECP